MNRLQFCHEIDNVFDAIQACFVHVLLRFSGFGPWERSFKDGHGDEEDK